MQINKINFSELAKIVLWTFLIGLFGFQFFGFLLILYPFLTMQAAVEHGIFQASLAMVVASLLLGLVLDWLPALVLLGLYLPMVLAFHYGLMSNRGFWTIFVLMVLVFILSSLSINVGLYRNLDLQGLQEDVQEAIRDQSQVLEGALTDLEIRRFEQNLRQSMEFTASLIPAALLISSLITVYINFLLAGRRLLAKKILIVQPPAFPNLSVPRQTLLIAGALFLSGIIVERLEVNFSFDIILNSVVVFAFIYFINGLACASFFMYRLGVGGIFRLVGFFLILIIPALFAIIIMLGLIDSLFDIRHMKGSGSD